MRGYNVWVQTGSWVQIVSAPRNFQMKGWKERKETPELIEQQYNN